MFKRKSKSDKPAKAKKEKKPKKPKTPRKKKEKPAKAAPVAGVALKKQSLDVYTVMLAISFVAVLIACILLWRELSTYGSYPWWKAG